MAGRILITGGCGFIGVNLVAYLGRTPGTALRVLDNEVLGSREHLQEFPGVEFHPGDIRDPEAVRRALEGVDCVVHLAADTRVMDSIANPTFNFEVNVVGTFTLLSAMREMGVTRMVNASTGGAILGEAEPPTHERMLPMPAAPYGASKLAVEGYLSAFSQAYGFKAASLRFSNIYGPRSYHKGSVVAHLFKTALAGREFVVYGDGEQKRDYVHVDDICEGIGQAISRGASGVYQLGTGIPTTLNALIDLARKVMGPAYPLPVRYEDYRPGEIRNTWSDISKARVELDFAPETDLEGGLAETWRWFLAQSGN